MTACSNWTRSRSKTRTSCERVWRRINRPHGRIRLDVILEGALEFSRAYAGILVTETMLVRDLNDDADGTAATAAFLAQLRPATAYLAAPTRPPAKPGVRPPQEIRLHHAFEAFRGNLLNTAFNIGYEGNDFRVTGDAATDLLEITAVHPMREDAVLNFLKQAGAGEWILGGLVSGNRLTRIEYEGHVYYLRTLH